MTLDLRKASPETRVAVRAALAALLAVVVSHHTPWQRWYWAVMVAVLLVNGTWGENLRKAGQRLGMTGLGCLAAWGLDLLTHGHEREQIAVMLVSIFLAVYYRSASYPRMTFFISVYVIFLFAIIGQRPANVIKLRVIQTGVGIAVAVLASVIVPTPRSRSKWREQMTAFWTSAAGWFDASYGRLLNPASPLTSPLATADVVRPLETMRAQHVAAFYEGMFLGLSRDRAVMLMERTRMLGHDLLALSASAAAVQPEVSTAFRDELAALRDCTMSHFQSAIPTLFDGFDQNKWDQGECERRLEETEARLSTHAVDLVRQGRISREELISIAPVFTYTELVNRVLSEVAGESRDASSKDESQPAAPLAA